MDEAGNESAAQDTIYLEEASGASAKIKVFVDGAPAETVGGVPIVKPGSRVKVQVTSSQALKERPRLTLKFPDGQKQEIVLEKAATSSSAK